MTLVREPGSEIIAQFTVPTRGTWLNTAINTLPLDAVYNSNNIFVREGKLRRRPGLERINKAFPYVSGYDPYIIGGAMGVTPTAKIIYAVSTNRLYTYSDATNVWSSVAASTLFANTLEEVVDITFIESSSEYVALFANSAYPLKRWRIGDATAHAVPGTNIPSPRSICIAASRVIALIPPHTIVWSRVLDYTNFDALAVVKRAQTSDRGICIRSISALTFILYKEQSIHPARAQAGLDEGSAFSFSEPIIAEGPAGVYAVVEVNGIHIYMTKSGRIAMFDGTNYPHWIADGIWFFLQSDINQAAAEFIRGVYDYRLNVVVFYYPKDSETSFMTGMVVINLPFPGFEAQEGLDPYCFTGTCFLPVSHVCTKRFDDEIERSLIFTVFEGEGIPQNHIFNENVTGDAGFAFPCSFQTGLQAAPDARHIQTTIEVFLERSSGYGTVDVFPVLSNTLETPTGTIFVADGHTIDLALSPVNDYIGFNRITRFFGFRFEWSSTSTVKYSGTVVYDSVKRRK